MTGTYLRDLLDAVIGLLDTVNDALATADLVELEGFYTNPTPADAAYPHGVVTSYGQRQAARPFGPGTTVEELAVSVTLNVDGDEVAAVLYEGVAKAVLVSAMATLREAVAPDAALTRWEYVGGSSTQDDNRTNEEAWTVTLDFDVQLQWSVSEEE